MKDITQKVEINRAMFYAYFADKFALLEETIQHIFFQEFEKQTLNAFLYSKDNLLALIVTVCEFIDQSTRLCKSSDGCFEMLVGKPNV